MVSAERVAARMKKDAYPPLELSLKESHNMRAGVHRVSLGKHGGGEVYVLDLGVFRASYEVGKFPCQVVLAFHYGPVVYLVELGEPREILGEQDGQGLAWRISRDSFPRGKHSVDKFTDNSFEMRIEYYRGIWVIINNSGRVPIGICRKAVDRETLKTGSSQKSVVVMTPTEERINTDIVGDKVGAEEVVSGNDITALKIEARLKKGGTDGAAADDPLGVFKPRAQTFSAGAIMAPEAKGAVQGEMVALVPGRPLEMRNGMKAQIGDLTGTGLIVNIGQVGLRNSQMGDMVAQVIVFNLSGEVRVVATVDQFAQKYTFDANGAVKVTGRDELFRKRKRYLRGLITKGSKFCLVITRSGSNGVEVALGGGGVTPVPMAVSFVDKGDLPLLKDLWEETLRQSGPSEHLT